MELKRWLYKNSINKVAESTDFFERLMQVKNIKEEDRAGFISPVFHANQSAKLFKESVEAANYVKAWMKERKKIIIFGDYDVDGTSATAILLKTFSYLGYDNVSFHIPSRFTEGYGINEKSIEILLKKSPDAIISVDCGINANDGVKKLKELGIEVLITDHHTIPDVLPNADYILDPKLCSEKMPFYDLCGAGVAFYLALNLLDDDVDYAELLQLAALATIADLVPLSRDNRLIVSSGIKTMKEETFLPLKELFDCSNLSLSDLNAGNLAFKIAPCINAAGRLKHAYEALKLFMAEDTDSMKKQAKYLFDLNNERKGKQEKVITEACEMIEKDPSLLEDGIITVYSDEWHEGVIGIAASKLVEMYNRPAIVFSLKDGVLKGSARSVGSFSIYQAIDSGREHLITFGGHQVACGLSLALEQFEAFRMTLKTHCDSYLKDEDLALKQKIDIVLDAGDISAENLEILNQLEPFGIGNPRPTLCLKDMNIASAFFIGKKKEHLKTQLEKDGNTYDSIMFSPKNPRAISQDYRVDIAFHLKDNNFRNKTSLQLMLKNIRFYDPSVKGLPSYAFSYFFKEYFTQIIEHGDIIDYSKYEGLKKVDDDGVWDKIKDESKIIVNNMESFLSLLYVMYDSGISLKKLLDYDYVKGIINVLPTELSDEEYLYGYNSFYVPFHDAKNLKYKDYILSQLGYNEMYLTKMYSYLAKVNVVNSLQFIYSSLYPLKTIIGLAFFKEAGFIREEGGNCIFIDKEHKKYQYERSKIKLMIDKFYTIL